MKKIIIGLLIYLMTLGAIASECEVSYNRAELKSDLWNIKNKLEYANSQHDINVARDMTRMLIIFLDRKVCIDINKED